MRNIGENEITNMGGSFNYINCECITDVGNLANFSTFINGFIGSNGVLTQGTNQEMTSDYIPVTQGKRYKFEYDQSKKTVANFWCAIGYYDIDKTFISRPSTGETTEYETLSVTIPNNVFYIKVSARFLQGASWVRVTEIEV